MRNTSRDCRFCGAKKGPLGPFFNNGGEGGITHNSLRAVMTLRASPLTRLGAKCSVSRIWSNPGFSFRYTKKTPPYMEASLFIWRRRRDSNPRYAINVYSLSRGAPSATRPLLRILSLTLFDVSLWKLPGSALLDALRLALRVALVSRALLAIFDHSVSTRPLLHVSSIFYANQRARENITTETNCDICTLQIVGL